MALGRDPGALERVAKRYGFLGRLDPVDLADPGAFEERLRFHSPAVVFNLVGYGVDSAERDEELLRRINVDLAIDIARAVAGTDPHETWRGARLVHVGSAFEYGLIEDEIDEDSVPRPSTPYGRTKLEATRRVIELCDGAGVPAVVARLCTVYGPGEHPHRLLPSLYQAAVRGEVLKLTSGRQERDFTYVGDVADGLLRLGAAAPSSATIVNLATGVLHSVRSFAECGGRVLRMTPEQLCFGGLEHREDEVWQGRVKVDRLRGLLGWQPATGIEEGIRATVEFLERGA
jgi:nucleoside-diphosphate-sugar epimerase